MSSSASCRPSQAGRLKFLTGTPANVREDQAAIFVANRDETHFDQAGHDDQVDVLAESSSAYFLDGHPMKTAKTEFTFDLGHNLPLLNHGDSSCRERLSAHVIIAGEAVRRQRSLRFVRHKSASPTGATIASAAIKIARH
jgi:hypothetical protein